MTILHNDDGVLVIVMVIVMRIVSVMPWF
jgi:hypothetical protein